MMEKLGAAVEAAKEIKTGTEKKFDIDKRIEPRKEKIDKTKDGYNLDARIEKSEERDVFCEKIKLYSPYKARIDLTPKEGSAKGEWSGARGESKFIPSDKDVQKCLKKYGENGVQYKNGIPDFSKFSKGLTVEIDNMTADRSLNYKQAYEKFAEKWSAEARNGKTDWTASEVKAEKNRLGCVLHENSDMKTIEMVPELIHEAAKHSGGRYECSIRDYVEETFDE